MLISVITPVYKGEKLLVQDFTKKYKYLQSRFGEGNFEMIYVFDGALQNNPKKLLDLKNKSLRVVFRAENKGKGFSVKEGFSLAKGKFLCFIDFDPEVPVKFIGDMYDALINSNADFCIGNRFDKKSIYKTDLVRKSLSRGYLAFNKMLFGSKFPDSQAGIKMIRKDGYDKIKKDLTVDGFAFDIELIESALHRGLKLVTIPIEYIREDNISTIKPITPINMAKESVKIWKKSY